MIEINLLPPANLLSVKETAVRNKLLLLVGVVSATLLLDLGLFFSTQAVLKRSVSLLVQKREELLTQLDAVANTALDLRTVQEKAAGVVVARKARADVVKTVTDMRAWAGDNIELLNFTVDSTGQTVFTARVGKLPVLNQFLAEAGNSQTGFTANITMKNLRQGPDGYGFSVEAKHDDQL